MTPPPPPEPRFALSVKQPWAALLAHGVKCVEVRTWPASRRGRILIHASKVPDERPEAWKWVTTPALRPEPGDAVSASAGGNTYHAVLRSVNGRSIARAAEKPTGAGIP